MGSPSLSKPVIEIEKGTTAEGAKPEIAKKGLSFQQQLGCSLKSCANAPTVPLQIVLKGNNVVDVHHCPLCSRNYKSILPMSHKDEWMPFLKRNIFRCDICGTLNEGNWQIAGGEQALKQSPRLKIFMTCKKCKKRRAKIISTVIWREIYAPQPATDESKEDPISKKNGSV
jgi:hypothetical protein